MKKYYYERSNLLESDVNIKFEELLYMNEEETSEWIENLRSFIISEWDDKGIPPTIGADLGKFMRFKKIANPKRPKIIDGTAARLLMLTSIKSVNLFFGQKLRWSNQGHPHWLKCFALNHILGTLRYFFLMWTHHQLHRQCNEKLWKVIFF